MLKRLLLSSIILSSIGLSAQAIDINIPGADPSVASNAYENYVFSDEYIKLDKTKMVSESYEASKNKPDMVEYKKENSLSDQELKKITENYASMLLGVVEGKTDVILHTKQGGIHVTTPLVLDYKIKLDNPHDSTIYSWDTRYIPFWVNVDDYSSEKSRENMTKPSGNFTGTDSRKLILQELSKNQKSTMVLKQDSVQGADFTYPRLRDSYWEQASFKEKQSKDIYWSNMIRFVYEKEPDVQYRLGFIIEPKADNHPSSDIANQLLVNYVLPSITPLADMNAYSKQIIPNDTNVFSYRVLKDSLVSDEVLEGHQIKVYNYNDTILQHVDYVSRPTSNSEDPYGYVDDILSLGQDSTENSNTIKSYHYNLVWNDGIPGIFLEQEFFDGSGLMQFITQNDKVRFINVIEYEKLDQGITKAQLRNMLIDVNVLQPHSKNSDAIDVFNLIVNK